MKRDRTQITKADVERALEPFHQDADVERAFRHLCQEIALDDDGGLLDLSGERST